MSQDLEAIIVFGSSLGEIKRYYQFVETFVTQCEAINGGLDVNSYDALFADIRPGVGVFDPRTFPYRGITRIGKKLDIALIRQILAALYQNEHTQLKYMLLVLGDPAMLNIIERYSILFARIRYRRQLRVHKIMSETLIYDYLLKNVLYMTPSMKKIAVKEHFPILKILWKCLLYLPSNEYDQFTFVRSLNFLADILDQGLFKSFTDCCNKISSVEEVYSARKNYCRLPFSVVKIILRNLTAIKKRELSMKLILQRMKNLNKNLSTLSNSHPSTDSMLIQLKRDLDSAINRYHETLSEFDHGIIKSNIVSSKI